jgi:hypothetical protein
LSAAIAADETPPVAMASAPCTPDSTAAFESGVYSSVTMIFLRRWWPWKRQRGWVWSDESST